LFVQAKAEKIMEKWRVTEERIDREQQEKEKERLEQAREKARLVLSPNVSKQDAQIYFLGIERKGKKLAKQLKEPPRKN
jgi:hypothetical protein